MKVIKVIVKSVFFLVILALLLAPLYLIWRISRAEMRVYTAPETPVLRESAYGETVKSARQDVEIFVTVSGTGVSVSFADQELKLRHPEKIRWSVTAGEAVTEGQVLGILDGTEILAEQTGVLTQINAYSNENAYLRYSLLEPVELECAVDSSTLWALENAVALSDGNGTALTLSYTSPVCNPDGSVTVRLAAEAGTYRFGEHVEKLRIYTGKRYPQTLVLDQHCLYQKLPGEGNPWYVRRVTEDGYFIEEIEVQVGYTTGALACVSGISEGDWFDAGVQFMQTGG